MITASASFPEWLYISTIVAYCVLILPTIFVWRKHGRQGFLGWNFVYGFCAIRIAGAALSVASINKPGLKTTASIVNSMAISPLLLAALGVLSEARKARYLVLQKRLELAFVIMYHVVVTGAMVLLIIAIVNITKGTETAQDSTLMKLGLALLVVAWVVVTACTIFSLRAPTYPNSITFSDSTKLVFATFLALHFIGIRVIYSVLAFLLTDASFATSVGAKVALSAIPEFIATAVFVAAGLVTRNMWEGVGEVNVEPKPNYELGQVSPYHIQPHYEWTSERVGYAV